MGSDLHRSLRLLTMGRSRSALLIEAAGVATAAIALWIIAAAFVLQEPIR